MPSKRKRRLPTAPAAFGKATLVENPGPEELAEIAGQEIGTATLTLPTGEEMQVSETELIVQLSAQVTHPVISVALTTYSRGRYAGSEQAVTDALTPLLGPLQRALAEALGLEPGACTTLAEPTQTFDRTVHASAEDLARGVVARVDERPLPCPGCGQRHDSHMTLIVDPTKVGRA